MWKVGHFYCYNKKRKIGVSSDITSNTLKRFPKQYLLVASHFVYQNNVFAKRLVPFAVFLNLKTLNEKKRNSTFFKLNPHHSVDFRFVVTTSYFSLINFRSINVALRLLLTCLATKRSRQINILVVSWFALFSGWRWLCSLLAFGLISPL